MRAAAAAGRQAADRRDAVADPGSSRRSHRPASGPWPLAGAIATLALLALDAAAVPAALPSVRIELGSSTSGLVWMQDAYLLALAVLLLLLWRLPAYVDRRLAAAAGVAAVAAGAAAASGADSTATVVVGRVLQGAGCAALLVAALEHLRAANRDRRLLLVVLAAAALLVLAVAPVIGGGLAEQPSWRWVFRLELAPAALAALMLMPAPSETDPRPAWSEPMTAIAAAGLLCAAIGLVQAEPWGWGSPETILLLAAGAVLLMLAWREGLTAPAAIALTLAGCLCASVLFVPQYFELVRGLSPLRSGLLTVAVTGPAVTLAALAGLAPARRAGRAVATAGLLCAAAGMLGATRIDPASSYALVVLSLALFGAGAGAAAGALTHHRRADARPLVQAAAAGAALVVAAAGALFQRAQLAERDDGASFEGALAAGLARSAWLLAALLAAAALLAWRRWPTG
jgi:MFS family permease